MTVLCDIRNLSVTYHGDVDVRAVQDVNLTIGRGEIFGLAGESGCGKSTIVLALTRLLDRSGEISGGEILFEGQDLVRLSDAGMRPLRWAKISLVTQSAMSSLNPVLTIGEQLCDGMVAHGVSRREAWSRAGELLRLVEVDPGRMHSYPHELSGGMRQRVMIAMALALRPKLIVMDEPTTALDVVVQQQIIRKVKELQGEFDFSLLFITHDMSLLLAIADRIAIMYAGEIVEVGAAAEIRHSPQHPYTKGLLQSFPSVFEKRELIGIPGSPPSMVSPPPGCRFAQRCPVRLDECDSVAPQTRDISSTHRAACHLLGEGGDGHV